LTGEGFIPSNYSAHRRGPAQKVRAVAKNSDQMQGKAVDLRLSGLPLKVLHKAALTLRRGGVGYYPKSDFVHVDCAEVRSW